MAEETITIYKLDTTDAVKSVQDLKDNIKFYKEEVNNAEIGTKEYQDALKNLQENQAALKNAMYATSASIEDVTKAAKGTGKSYNALVKQMAGLKQSLRSVDTSTEEGNKKFKEYALQIHVINDELKRMDAQQGVFSRNVGDYTNSIGQALNNVDKFGGNATKAVKKFGDGLKVASATPIVAVLGVIIRLFEQVKGAMDNSVESTEAMTEAMKPLADIGKIVTRVFDYLAQAVANLVVKISNFIQKVAPNLVTKLHDFAEEAEKGMTKQVEDESKKRDKAREKEKKEAEKKLKEIKKFSESIDSVISAAEAKEEKERRKKIAFDKEIDDFIKDFLGDSLDGIDEYTDAFIESLNAQMEAEKIAAEKEKQITEARKATMFGLADATASIFDTMAEMEDENSGKSKVLKIASATIDTISGAIKAFMSCQELPPPFGQIAGAANAAAVTAAGMANISKMKSTQVGSHGSSGVSVSAPSIPTILPNVRSITTATEEERLNQMSSDQRVYILSSDIEASQNHIRVQTAESSF